MYHCSRRGRGVPIKAFPAKHVVFLRDCSYERMLEKCQQEVYPEPQTGAKYYIADSTGVDIRGSGFITVDNKAGEEERLLWTLDTYLLLSHKKHPSKARFYYVQAVSGMATYTANAKNPICTQCYQAWSRGTLEMLKTVIRMMELVKVVMTIQLCHLYLQHLHLT